MTARDPWHTAKLFNLDGQHIGQCRVPNTPMPPPLILWGYRYFILALPDGDYMEARCFTVTLKNMSAAPSEVKKLPFRKAEK